MGLIVGEIFGFWYELVLGNGVYGVIIGLNNGELIFVIDFFNVDSFGNVVVGLYGYYVFWSVKGFINCCCLDFF